MKTSIFIIIVLLSGAFAGFIHGTVNFAIVEPYLDQAIGIENQNLFDSYGITTPLTKSFSASAIYCNLPL